MVILICRHALAADRDGDRYPDDTLRPLVAKGRKRQARISRRLAQRGMTPAVIFSSPWKRAWQTAGVLARESGAGKNRRVVCPPLATDPNVAALAEAVGPRGSDEVVALVGHDPWVSELASLILTGSPTRLAIEFEKSGIVAIAANELAPACGKLLFFWET
jgi:phosphohistidine phosphatase